MLDRKDRLAVLHIDYDRNRLPDGPNRMANLLFAFAAPTGGLYVDFYVTPTEANTLPGFWQAVPDADVKPGILGRLLPIESISTYVCAPLSTTFELTALWEEFVHTTPKLYRVGSGIFPGEKGRLVGELVDRFQFEEFQNPLLQNLLESHVCIFRDGYNEVGLEVLCRKEYVSRLRHLVDIFLGENLIEALEVE